MKAKIHIWDLPIEKVYIKFKDGFREQFFESAYQRFETWNKLANFLRVKRGDTLLARNWKDGECCCPLSITLKISNELNIPKSKIEQNIKEIRYKTKLEGKGGNSGGPIINPKLPIEINEDFTEILGHICGDGTIIRKNPKKGLKLGYINSESVLIKSFQEKIKKVFGDIRVNIQIRDGPTYRRKNFYLQYPSILSLFILSVFDYKTGEEMDIPNFIFDLPKKSQYVFLRALFDDEGNIETDYKAIAISLKPKKPLEKIRKLLITLGFNPSHIFISGNIRRIVLMRKKDILLFKKFIGFKHPLKQKKLDLIIERGWKFERYTNGEPEQKILSFLKKRKDTQTEEIIKFLGRHPSTAREHLRRLKQNNLIFNRRGDKYNMWSLR